MNSTSTPICFTVADGIKIQEEQLSRWESVLEPGFFAKIKKLVQCGNHKAVDGFDVCRGTSITEIIHNQLLLQR